MDQTQIKYILKTKWNSSGQERALQDRKREKNTLGGKTKKRKLKQILLKEKKKKKTHTQRERERDRETERERQRASLLSVNSLADKRHTQEIWSDILYKQHVSASSLAHTHTQASLLSVNLTLLWMNRSGSTLAQ